MAAEWIGKTVGSYRILRQLGEGGMGMVFEAMHESIARRVAIKVLHAEYARNPEAARRFFNEARAVNLIEHPSLVQISDFGQLPDGTAYLIMELLRGESLAHRFRRVGPMPVVQVLQIGWQIADVLCAAHTQQIVHRDLKPENLMLVPDPVAPGGERVKVLDFGIAKVARSGQPLTQSRVIMGTPKYMSPEQCRGAGEVDDRSDVYSLGVMLYELLAGKAPFEGEQGELIGRHLFMEPPNLGSLVAHLPPPLVSLVHGLLAKDKASRPRMADVRAALGQQLTAAGSTVATTPVAGPNPAPLAPPRQKALSTLGGSVGQTNLSRRRTRLLGGIALGTSLLVGGGLLLRTLQPAKQEPRPATQESRATSPPEAPLVLPPSTPEDLLPPPQVETEQSVHWQIRSEPTGAAVLDESGRLLGKTPWTQAQTSHAGEARVRLRLAGFREQTLTLRQDLDENRLERLQPLPKATPPLPKEEPRRPPKPASGPTVPSKKGVLDGVD
ncbi:MAG: protein kinase [Polyangia bacterium]